MGIYGLWTMDYGLWTVAWSIDPRIVRTHLSLDGAATKNNNQ
jgi:hypothetical protein